MTDDRIAQLARKLLKPLEKQDAYVAVEALAEVAAALHVAIQPRDKAAAIGAVFGARVVERIEEMLAEHPEKPL